MTTSDRPRLQSLSTRVHVSDQLLARGVETALKLLDDRA